jgi:alpha-D-ribose 1-methylphosphonate 5-triphosphate synthase subunit PhnH
MSALSKKHSFDEVLDGQKVYRRILKAVSNPTGVVNIKEFADKLYGEEPAMLAIAVTLLDNEVSFSSCGSQALSDEILSLTLSRQEQTEEADYIFVTDRALLETAIRSAKCGTLRDPHKSATLLVKNTGSRQHPIRLFGPGMKAAEEAVVTDIVRSALEIRDSQEYAYPQGIDFLFVSEDGDLFSIPRRIRRKVN